MNNDDSLKREPTERIVSGGPGKNILHEVHGDCEVTQPLVMLRLVDEPPFCAGEEMGVDPYNSGG